VGRSSLVAAPPGSPWSHAFSWSVRWADERCPETPNGTTSVAAAGSPQSKTKRINCPNAELDALTHEEAPLCGSKGGSKSQERPGMRPSGWRAEKAFRGLERLVDVQGA
jgi:hypothetical protein